MKCSIDCCEKDAKKRGWCGTHYRRWWRTGSPLIVRPRPSKHGLHSHPLYALWATMMARCYNPKQVQYHRYGARGITVCESWHTLENFIADMSPRPDGMTIDRKDGYGGYSKDNCRWATPAQQSQNRKSNRFTMDQARFIRAKYQNGLTLTQLASAFNVRASHIHSIVKNNLWKD